MNFFGLFTVRYLNPLHFLLLELLLVGFGTPLLAATISLPTLLAEAEKSAPANISAQKMAEAARSDVTAKVWPDQPSLGTEYFLTTGDVMMSVQQSIPLPWMVLSKLSYYKSGKEKADLMRLVVRHNVASDVKKNFAMYWREKNKEEIYRVSVELMRQYSSLANANYETGKGSAAELVAAQVRIGRMESDREMAESDALAAKEMLLATLGRTNTAELGDPSYTNEIPPFLSFSNFSILQSPEVKAALTSSKQSEAALSMAKAEWLPELMASVKIGMPSSVMVSASVPLFFWKQAAEVNKMKSEKVAAQNDYLDVLNKTSGELRGLMGRYEAARKRAIRYRDMIIPLSDQVLKLNVSSFVTGKGMFNDITMSMDQFLKDKSEYFDAVTEARMLLADLERITALELEDKK